MDGEDWQGLTVRVHDGAALGVVVGEFPDGLLAGRMRVEGKHARGRQERGLGDGVDVYAIPRRAVVRRQQDSLVLDTTFARARSRWLMHIVPPWRAC
jgi:hypothetical protein